MTSSTNCVNNEFENDSEEYNVMNNVGVLEVLNDIANIVKKEDMPRMFKDSKTQKIHQMLTAKVCKDVVERFKAQMTYHRVYGNRPSTCDNEHIADSGATKIWTLPEITKFCRISKKLKMKEELEKAVLEEEAAVQDLMHSFMHINDKIGVIKSKLPTITERIVESELRIEQISARNNEIVELALSLSGQLNLEKGNH